MMPVIRQVDTKEKYSRLLKSFYEYYAPLMERISVEIDTHYLPDFNQRRKAESILDDLRIMDKEISMTLSPMVPEIKNSSDAFGALYVLEGSTLGGVFIANMLSQNMHITEQKGLSFFYGYGKASREMWNVFTEQINKFTEEKGNEEAILAAASETFTLFKQHLQLTLQYN